MLLICWGGELMLPVVDVALVSLPRLFGLDAPTASEYDGTTTEYGGGPSIISSSRRLAAAAASWFEFGNSRPAACCTARSDLVRSPKPWRRSAMARAEPKSLGATGAMRSAACFDSRCEGRGSISTAS